LAEVLAAVAILALTAVSVLFLFMTGTGLDAAGYKLTAAQAAAQLRMEEMVAAVDGGQLTVHSYGFPVDVAVFENYEGFAGLVHVVVTVFDADGVGVLCRLENVLNVLPGGLEND